MGKQNRTTLKNYFQTGKVPTQQQYGDLIDSFINLEDTDPQIIQGTMSSSKLSIGNDITASSHVLAGGYVSASEFRGVISASQLVMPFTQDVYTSGDLSSSANLNIVGSASFTDITASGNILVSGVGTYISASVGEFHRIRGGSPIHVEDALIVSSSITASADIKIGNIIFDKTNSKIKGAAFDTVSKANITDLATLNVTGNITSSGEISASGDLKAGGIELPDNADIVWAGDANHRIATSGNPNDLDLYADRNLRLYPDSKILIHEGSTQYAEFNGTNRGFEIEGDITCSAGILSGSKIYAERFYGSSNSHYISMDSTNTGLGTNGSWKVGSHLTASGDISSSGAIISNEVTASGVSVAGTLDATTLRGNNMGPYLSDAMLTLPIDFASSDNLNYTGTVQSNGGSVLFQQSSYNLYASYVIPTGVTLRSYIFYGVAGVKANVYVGNITGSAVTTLDTDISPSVTATLSGGSPVGDGELYVIVKLNIVGAKQFYGGKFIYA